MANIKISELNEALIINDNDLFVIDDVTNNETKKIKANSVILNEKTTNNTKTYSCSYINGIVESGSNSNGSYVKYIDGTMICYGDLLQNPPTESSSGWFDVTLPATFIDTNYRTTVNNTYNYFIDIFWTVGTQTTTSQHLHWTRVDGNIPTSQEVGCQWIAIGKWK